MFFKDVGYVMREVPGLDEMHRPKVSYTEEQVFCNVKSIGQSEFYQAQTAGLKPEIKIEVKLVDLNGATHFKYNNTIYKILRTYKKEDITELTLTSMVIPNERN